MSLDHSEMNRGDRYAGDEEQGFDFFGFLMRRKGLIVFGVIAGLSLSYMYFRKQPAAYQSSGRVLVRKQQSRLVIEDGSMVDPSLRQRDPLADDIFLIRSRDIIEPAIKENSLDELPTLKRSANPVDAVIGGLTVGRGDDTANVLDIRFKGPFPDDCQDVVNAVIRSYRKYLQQQFVHSNEDSVNLLTVAKDELHDDLQAAEKEYREFVTSAPLQFLDGRAVNPYSAQIVSTETTLAELKNRLGEIEGRIQGIDKALKRGGSREALRLMIDQTARMSDGEGPIRETLASKMANDLLPMLIEEQELLQTHGPEHPKVTALRTRIAMTKGFLQDQDMQNAPGPKKKAPDFLTVYVESLQLQKANTLAQQSELVKVLVEAKVESKKLAEMEIRYLELQREIERITGLHTTVLAKLKDVSFATGSGGYFAEVISDASRGWQVAPNLAKTLTFGGLLGCLCGLLLGYVVESADQSFKSPEEISTLLGQQIIGHCPLITGTGKPKDAHSVDPSVITFYKPKSRGAEAFRAIRTALYFSTRGAAHKVIQITSPHPGDGKSTLSSNLSVAIAQSGKKVIIVDADFRRPRVHKIFGVNNDTGMSSAIAGDVELFDAIQETPVANLDCLACGPRPDNPSELLTSAKFEQFLDLLREKYDFVLVDTPPVLAVTDPSAVAARVDGVILCIRVNNKSRIDAMRATELLNQLDANILGIVVNGIDGSAKGKYGYGSRGYYKAGHMYGYGYGYGYGMSDEAAHPSHAKYFADDADVPRPSSRRQRTRS